MIWIILAFIVAVVVASHWQDRDPNRQAMTKEQRLEHDIAQLSPEWQATIRSYREKKNNNNVDC